MCKQDAQTEVYVTSPLREASNADMISLGKARLTRNLLFASFLLLVAMAVGCRNAGDSSPVIVTLNGHDIHRDEFERFLSSKLAELSSADVPDMVRSQMLDEYLKRQLILDEAARLGLSVTSAELEQSAEDNPQMKQTVGIQATRDELARDLLVEKYYRQVVSRDVRVSPEEVQQYIEKNQSRLTDRPGYLVREIRVQSRDEADRLRREVTEGRRDFASVARLHSDAPNSERNGLARYDEGQLPAALDKAVKQLNPGDVSPVIESNYGFHIFKLEQRTKPHAPDERRSQLDERRQQLTEELIARRNQQAVDKVLDSLTSEARIKINDSALGFTYSGQLRHN
ncbi:MAG TPA: peptidyl-prolyl cis-trans isomerase [Blastocatellia bacterium]|nr:peptidyl-prolyl cis-trans isomerase [Blastocatellia bacterium]